MADITQIRIERPVAGGVGLGRDIAGKVVLVRGALPDELVEVDLDEGGPVFDPVRTLEHSDQRVDPHCPMAAQGCGGCDAAGVDTAYARQLKREVVEDALVRLGKQFRSSLVIDDGPQLAAEGFRTTLRMVATGDGGLGFRAARSHDVVKVAQCPVAHPLLAPYVKATWPRPAGTEVTLRCGAGTEDVLIVDRPKSPETYTERVGGRTWQVSAESFFQTRGDGAEALVDAVLAAAAGLEVQLDRPLRSAIDLSAGVGLFAGALADVHPTAKITAVEPSKSAVGDARVNLEGLNVRIIRSTTERFTPRPGVHVGADLVVADPPRRGLAKKGVAVVKAIGPQRLVLISCDPASLGRDTALLTDAGFKLMSARLIDLFPHTHHIEVVSIFDRVQ